MPPRLSTGTSEDNSPSSYNAQWALRGADWLAFSGFGLGVRIYMNTQGFIMVALMSHWHIF